MPTPVESYAVALPAPARPVVERLLAIVRGSEPGLAETISYGIPTFRRDGKAVLHVAGYAGHVSIHPRPDTSEDPQLAQVVEPYVAGKGTLRFSLDTPLPEDVVRRVVAALLGAR